MSNPTPTPATLAADLRTLARECPPHWAPTLHAAADLLARDPIAIECYAPDGTLLAALDGDLAQRIHTVALRTFFEEALRD